MTFEVIYERPAQRSLAKLDGAIRARVIREVGELAKEPRPQGAIQLAGSDRAWRVRVGDYRIVYEINDGKLLVVVIQIGHRSTIYRNDY